MRLEVIDGGAATVRGNEQGPCSKDAPEMLQSPSMVARGATAARGRDGGASGEVPEDGWYSIQQAGVIFAAHNGAGSSALSKVKHPEKQWFTIGKIRTMWRWGRSDRNQRAKLFWVREEWRPPEDRLALTAKAADGDDRVSRGVRSINLGAAEGIALLVNEIIAAKEGEALAWKAYALRFDPRAAEAIRAAANE